MSDSATSPPCPKCDSRLTARVKREGLLQTLIYYRLGLYPWECTECRNHFLYKDRGKVKRRRPADEVGVPPVG